MRCIIVIAFLVVAAALAGPFVVSAQAGWTWDAPVHHGR